MLGESGKQLKQFGWIHGLACPSENTLWVGELLNWRAQKLLALIPSRRNAAAGQINTPIRAGFRAARQSSHCRRHNDNSTGAKAYSAPDDRVTAASQRERRRNAGSGLAW